MAIRQILVVTLLVLTTITAAAHESQYGNPGASFSEVLHTLDEPVDGLQIAKVRFPGTAKGKPLSKQPDHRHPVWEMFIVLSGTLEIEIDSVVQFLNVGEIGVLPPNAAVKHRSGSGNPVEVLVIWTSSNEMSRIANTFNIPAFQDK